MFWIGLYICNDVCLYDAAHKYAVSLQMMFHWQGMKCMSFWSTVGDSNLRRVLRHNAFQQIKDVIQQLHQHNQSNHTWKPKIKSSILWNITCKSNPQYTLLVQEHSQHVVLVQYIKIYVYGNIYIHISNINPYTKLYVIVAPPLKIMSLTSPSLALGRQSRQQSQIVRSC